MKIRTLSISLIALALCTQADASNIHGNLTRGYGTRGLLPVESVPTPKTHVIGARKGEPVGAVKSKLGSTLRIGHDKFKYNPQVKQLKDTDLSASFNILDSAKQEYEASIKISPEPTAGATLVNIIDKLPAFCSFKWSDDTETYKLDAQSLKLLFSKLERLKIVYTGTVEFTLTPIWADDKKPAAPTPTVAEIAPTMATATDSRADRVAAMGATENWK